MRKNIETSVFADCRRMFFEWGKGTGGTSRALRAYPARTVLQTLLENGRGKTDGRDSIAMGDTAIALLRGVPDERSDKKCALRGQRRRQLYLSRRGISPLYPAKSKWRYRKEKRSSFFGYKKKPKTARREKGRKTKKFFAGR